VRLTLVALCCRIPTGIVAQQQATAQKILAPLLENKQQQQQQQHIEIEIANNNINNIV
jgi:hypothetical protein